MTELKTGYNVNILPNSKVIKNRLYLTNDYDPVQMWDAINGSMLEMGMTAPTGTIGAPTQFSGNPCTNGIHFVRYRFRDSTSPAGAYVSNPSGELEITITGNLSQQFSVGSVGTEDIVWPVDDQLDTVVLEMTEADGTTYYVAAEHTVRTTGFVSIEVTDTQLIAGTAVSTYGDFGHEKPPLVTCIAECKGYSFIGGTSEFSIGSLTTNGTTAVTGTNIPEHVEGRYLRFGTESAVYTISTWNSATSITLSIAHAGTSGIHTSAVTSKTPSRIYWSQSGYPESFKILERARDMLQGKDDTIVGMTDYVGDLWVFGRYSMERLIFTSDPATGERIDAAGYFGLWNQRCLVHTAGRMFGWGTHGAWVMNGARPQWLSERADVTIEANIDHAYADLFHAAYDPKEKVIRWWYVAAGETECKRAFVYDTTRDQFSIEIYRKEINGSSISPDSDSDLHLYVCDDDFSWIHEGDTDGVPNNDRYFTVNTATATAVTVNETINGTTTEWNGVTIYNATQDLTTIITGISSSSIFTTETWTAPSYGDDLFVGSIPVKIATPWFVTNSQNKLRPEYLHLEFNPSSSGSIRVRYYTDFSSTAEIMDVGTEYEPPDGVVIIDGTNYLDVDIDGGSGDGFVAVPIIADWARSIKAEVECFDNRGELKLLNLSFAENRTPTQVDGE